MAGDGIEALGEAVSGGAAARAVEPHGGVGADGHSDGGGKCLNCGCDLVGAYCHCCGQEGHVHRTLGAWWHDLAHGVLHFDGKIWRTLPLLAWHPGRLTRRFIEGERAKFVSPLALFLFSVFTMFASFSLLGADLIGSGNPERDQREIAQAQAKVDKLATQRAEIVKAGKPTAQIDSELIEAKASLELETKLSGFARGSADFNANTGWDRLDHGIEKAAKNPSLLFYKLQSNAYKFSWALIPISLPLLWVLFLHRRRYRAYKAYDHIVFITYSIAAMSLLLIAAVLLNTMGVTGGWLMILLVFVPPLHIYRQLRGAYQLSRPSAIWRTFALLFFASWALTFFTLLLLALGVSG
jgi:hypothetical protein